MPKRLAAVSTPGSATASSAVRKRRAYRRDQEARPAQILDAAFDIFSKEGFAAARVEDMARSAGVTKGLVYFYFRNKEELFKAVVRASVQVPAMPAKASATNTPDVATTLEQWLTFFYENVAANPRAQRLLRIMIAEGDRFPEIREFYYRELIAPILAFMADLMRVGVRSGQLTRALKHPQIIMGPALAFSLWRTLFHEFSPVEPAAYAREHLELVLDGLGAKRAKRTSKRVRAG